jgi:hypothetical protein
MNHDLESTLHRVIRALEFRSSEEFVFAGKPSSVWAPGQPAPGAQNQQNPLVQSLQNALYGNCYTRHFQGPLEETTGSLRDPDGGWLESLSAANMSKERWEEGWQIQRLLPNGQVFAQKSGMVRAFWPGEFITRANHGMAPQPGTPVAVFFPRESRGLQAGFYFIFGETVVDQYDEFPTVRYYWNVQRAGGAPLVRALSGALNKYQVPFRMKILNHPAMLGRSDAAIVYLGQRYYRVAAEICRETRDRFTEGLGDAVPLFTLQLAKGLSFAEDPGMREGFGQESFGMMRCRLLAEGLWLAFCESLTGPAERLERVRRHFATNGISLERPFLNTDSAYSYEFPQ